MRNETTHVRLVRTAIEKSKEALKSNPGSVAYQLQIPKEDTDNVRDGYSFPTREPLGEIFFTVEYLSPIGRVVECWFYPDMNGEHDPRSAKTILPKYQSPHDLKNGGNESFVKGPVRTYSTPKRFTED